MEEITVEGLQLGLANGSGLLEKAAGHNAAVLDGAANLQLEFVAADLATLGGALAAMSTVVRDWPITAGRGELGNARAQFDHTLEGTGGQPFIDGLYAGLDGMDKEYRDALTRQKMLQDRLAACGRAITDIVNGLRGEAIPLRQQVDEHVTNVDRYAEKARGHAAEYHGGL